MANSNEITLDVYERNFDKYIEGTAPETDLDHLQGRWIANALSIIPKNGKILEIGSAFGRDIKFMNKMGFKPEASDAFDAAVEYMNHNGIKARKLNVLSDQIKGNYDMILACAVFLHFTEQELKETLVKLQNSLNPDGILAFTVKNGEGESWQDHKMGEPRYFRFWNQEAILKMLESTDYTVLDEQMSEDSKWLHIIAKLKRTD